MENYVKGSIVLEIRCDAKRVMREMLPSAEWAMTNDLLTAEEAAALLTDAIIETLEIICQE